jgi:hypothetical protein
LRKAEYGIAHIAAASVMAASIAPIQKYQPQCKNCPTTPAMANFHPGTGWHNCEARSYVFESNFRSDNDEDAWLVETRESRTRRGKDYPMYGKKDQVKLFNAAMESWEGQGLQRPDEIYTDLEGDNLGEICTRPQDAQNICL